MKDSPPKTDTEAEAIRLAKGLLEIAELAMPPTYFQTDSRCELARKVLAKAAKPLGRIETQANWMAKCYLRLAAKHLTKKAMESDGCCQFARMVVAELEPRRVRERDKVKK